MHAQQCSGTTMALVFPLAAAAQFLSGNEHLRWFVSVQQPANSVRLSYLQVGNQERQAALVMKLS